MTTKAGSQLEMLVSADTGGFGIIAGVDEAGRGPLAGDVIAAAVILKRDQVISGLNDSKQLNQKTREHCYDQIVQGSAAYAIARATVAEIDRFNILQASLLAMQRAVSRLSHRPEHVYVDGTHCPRWDYPSTALVKGDARLACIAAASILAKVTRDREMILLDSEFPGYGFARHKGYPTRDHLAALSRLGPCKAHRRTFKPVAMLL